MPGKTLKRHYLVALHSFSGSMRESVGQQFVACLTEDEVEELELRAKFMQEDSEMYIWPVDKILNFSSVLPLIEAYITNLEDDEDED